MMRFLKYFSLFLMSQQAFGQSLTGFDYLKVEMVSVYNSTDTDQYMAGKVDICINDKCEGLRRTDMVRVKANTKVTVNFATKNIPVADLNSLMRRLNTGSSSEAIKLKLIAGVFAKDSNPQNPTRIVPLSSMSIDFPSARSFSSEKVLRNGVHVVVDGQSGSYIDFNVVIGKN